MKTIYNFGAGPACLPQEVLTQIRDDIPDWYDGMSIMELSHRLPIIVELTQSIEANFRKLLAIPDEFAVLFMHGGARGQFSAVPLNLLHGHPSANYLITGMWSELAFIEAKKYCQPYTVATSAPHFTEIPAQKDWTISDQSAYFHYTDNETIHGVEFYQTPQVEGQWLVSDMTSSILTKPIDFAPFGLIYASAQKNLGIAGITVVIVRKALLKEAHPFTPSILHYELIEKSQSMYNTSPVFAWYVLGLLLDWTIKQGGVAAFARLCEQKSTLLYDVIDNSELFVNLVAKANRSRVNIPFSLKDEKLETRFLDQANQIGLKQLKGHKAVGGCRASMYNAMPLAGAQALVEFMKTFEKTT